MTPTCVYVCVCFQTLKGLCLDSKRSKILQRLELSLDILGGTVERISNTAEVLGAVHQVHQSLGESVSVCGA